MSDSLEAALNHWKEVKANTKAQVFVPYENKIKTFKARIHRCKAECYKTQSYTRYIADECAKACQLPYSIFTDKNKSALEICENRFQGESQACLSKSLKDAEEGSVQIYKVCLRENQEEIRKNISISEQKFDEIVKYGKERVRVENKLSDKSLYD